MFSGLYLADNLALLSVVSIHIVFFYLYWRMTPKAHKWLLPSTFIAISCLAQYPVKALHMVYGMGPEEIRLLNNYDFNSFLAALVFATFFWLLFAITSVLLVKRYSVDKTEIEDPDVVAGSEMEFYVNVLFGIVVVSYSIRIFVLKYQGFMDYFVPGSILGTLVDNCLPLQWVTLFFSGVLAAKRKTRRYVVLPLAIIGLIVLDAIFSTAKGKVFTLAVSYLVYKNYLSQKISKYLFAIIVSLVVVSSMFSYVVRFKGTFRGEIDISTVSENIKVFQSEKDDLSQYVPHLLNRFNLLNNLVLTMEKSNEVDKGYYAYGSVVEILNIIPRVFWPDRPFLYFDYFVVSDLFGVLQYSSDSIGRIGEAYFVLGPLGCFMAIPYAAFFFWTYKHFFLQKSSLIYRFIFINFFFIYVINDAYLFQTTFSLFFTSGILVLLSASHSLLIGRKQVRY